MIPLLVAYYVAVNFILWGMMKHDKQQARRHGWRTPEKRLLTLGMIGGAFGGIAAMQMYRHKTKHAAFKYGYPAMAIVHLYGLSALFGVWK
ncbi:uncharacterized membrane protein YsdA (DUF1294 family) [Paenibacillus cellulosilyticus]|uniref:Uncharacterized membrane protein YsdA (DUF1294 family) n=1 Tax=Paenibacillus cellulosilyticus TaxID=375489 RepID=A0A2V2YYM0_9BACL|nr:DUF1294 domain-containing protein [Paenibacillus cellulosilyticus]PWW06516.1 uncharacterized membrane protein YsdA (DUF1294 family) [Paenibacillus cellulosilyticus]QKS46146.1 DUF1294 domain-containing protein [Paenibacillus cellulosilyticus]